MVIPKYFAILYASMIDGLYRPFSKELIVCRETPKAFAISSCKIPCSFLMFSILFFIRHLLTKCKAYFTSTV